MNAPDAPALLAPDAFAAARECFRAQGFTPFAFEVTGMLRPAGNRAATMPAGG